MKPLPRCNDGRRTFAPGLLKSRLQNSRRGRGYALMLRERLPTPSPPLLSKPNRRHSYPNRRSSYPNRRSSSIK